MMRIQLSDFELKGMGFFVALLLCWLPTGLAATLDPLVEKKVDALMLQMTLEEKVSLCSGMRLMDFRDIPRLNVPGMQLQDGPRGPHGGTAFPVGVAFGATWNPELIQTVGSIMGNESRAGAIGMLLGPGINIERDPLGGRFFEYYTEDPFLDSRLTVAIVKGIQSEGVAACLKHFVCNNREDNRNNYMSMVDQRTLNEIYFPAFKAAVQEGHAWGVMTSANGVNGDFVSDSKILLRDTLKNAWGFDGVVLTDWLQTRSTEKAALAGLDVSMPGGDDCGFGKPLLEAVKAGRVPMPVLDDKVRRVLRVYGYVGLLDHRRLETGASRNTPASHAIARQVAAEGIVLLKNLGKVLPLDEKQIHNVLVLGPNANQRFCVVGMGGSSWMDAPDEVTPLKGLRKVLGDGDRLTYLSTDDLGGFQPIPAGVMQPVKGVHGFAASYFAAGQRQPAVQRVEPQLNFMWEMRSPDPKIPNKGFRAEFVGRIIPPVTGTYVLRLSAGGSASINVEEAGGAPTAIADRSRGMRTATAMLQMTRDKPFFVRIDYSHPSGDASFNLDWEVPGDKQGQWDKVDTAAKAADAVVFFGGGDMNLDTEGRDRTDMDFPPVQQSIIQRVAKDNPKTVVVLINGSPLKLGGWLAQVPAVVEAWYPGLEGGDAVADVLFGRVNPSGHLPFTWPKDLNDSPSHAIGSETNDEVFYKEGLMVGYRYFDSRNIEPEFPFGFGLSYTTFAFDDLHVAALHTNATVNVSVKNTGDRDGLATVQFYVKPLHPSVPRPMHELKAFQKVLVKAGESTTVTVDLGQDAFSYYDVAGKGWKVDPGPYEIQAGLSSREILARSTVVITPPFDR
jgi:beta-glucosidase